MTNTVTHTPAPWAYEEDTGRIYFADGDIEPTVAVIDLDNTTPEQSKADGRLIAAAPAQALILNLVQLGLMTLEQGEAEFDGVMYWFDHGQPDWCVGVIDAIGWDAAHSASSLATAGRPPLKAGTAAVGGKRYFVMLLYPDYANNGGSETYYAFVDAVGLREAVALAQRQAADAQLLDVEDPTDFTPLLVTQWHHHREPFNK